MKFIKYKLLFYCVLSLLLFSCDNGVKESEFRFPSNQINKIIIDNNGVKWIATSKGLVSYDGQKWTAYAQNIYLSDLSVNDLAFETDSVQNQLWVASNIGATSFKASNNAVVSYYNYNQQHDSILDDKIFAVNIGDGNVKYFGTSKGLSILKENKWTDFFGRTREPILSEYEISAIASANDGWVYATTKGGGVSRFKYTDAVSGATTFNQPWAYGLKSDTVFTVFVDENSYQWFGTNKGLACHTSPNTKSDWISYSREDGLICDTVYAVNKDHAGKLWIGTAKGISTLDGDTWSKFTTADGLIDNNVKTIAVDLDGSIWFGTENGVSHYSNGVWESFRETSQK